MKKKTTDNYQRPFRPYSKRGVSSERPFTECLCPKCGAVHRMRIRWIGRGIPRKFCEKCRVTMERNTSAVEYEPSQYRLLE